MRGPGRGDREGGRRAAGSASRSAADAVALTPPGCGCRGSWCPPRRGLQGPPPPTRGPRSAPLCPARRPRRYRCPAGIAVRLGRLGACRGWALLSLSTWCVANVSGSVPLATGSGLASRPSCVSVFLAGLESEADVSVQQCYLQGDRMGWAEAWVSAIWGIAMYVM